MSTGAMKAYLGKVVHQRMRPKRHRLTYGVYLWLFDLDRLDAPGLRLFSHNRFNLFSFYDRDHGTGTGEPLRRYVDRQLRESNIDLEGGRVELLCCPRVLGYVFNPLSIYFCRDRNGTLLAILYEVNNTFGERHTYLIPADPAEKQVRHSCPKSFYVSPFIAMDMTYHFTVDPPGDRVAIRIREDDADGDLLLASFQGRRRELSDRTLLRLLVAYPLVTIKIVWGIHWQALRLWLKGVRLVERPAPPTHSVTVVANHVR